MARLPRPDLPGYPQHVIQRGNNRDVIFCADLDYRYYLEKLTDPAAANDCRIHAYVLMTNHVHLLMTPEREGAVSRIMQSLGRRYVRYFNRAYSRTGTLWEGRYRSTVVDTEQYRLTCMRYIDLSPVRAGIVEDAASYPWKSFRANALGGEDFVVSPHAEYKRLGQSGGERAQAYRASLSNKSGGRGSTRSGRRRTRPGCWATIGFARRLRGSCPVAYRRRRGAEIAVVLNTGESDVSIESNPIDLPLICDRV